MNLAELRAAAEAMKAHVENARLAAVGIDGDEVWDWVHDASPEVVLALLDVVDAARVVVDDGREHWRNSDICPACTKPWPCPQGALRAALAALGLPEETE